MDPALSLRQRKKDRTRARLLEASGRLFAEQGYDQTTLEQIAAEAEVSVPTLLTYFESKERLALAPAYTRLDLLRRALEAPGRQQSTLAIWRDFAKESAGNAVADPDWWAQGLQDRYSSLARGLLALLARYEEVIANGLAADYGTDPATDLATMLLATVLTYSTQTVERQLMAQGRPADLVARTEEVIDFITRWMPKPGETFG